MFFNRFKSKKNTQIANEQVDNRVSSSDITDKKVDETKEESATGVNNIIINSDVNVTVSAANIDSVIAHLHDESVTNGDVTFSVERQLDAIRITVKTNGNRFNCNNISINGSVINFNGNVINNCNIGNNSVISNNSSSNSNAFYLDIQIPNRIFNCLAVQSENADINIGSYVKAKAVSIDTTKGDIDMKAIFKILHIDTHNGNITVKSTIQQNVDLDIRNHNGNIDISLANVGISTASVTTRNGSTRISPNLNGVYKASGKISSYNGDVNFR